MKKISLLNSLIYGNKAIVICISFTIATLLDLVICTAQGITDISYWHLATRFVLCTLIVLSLYIFKLFENLPLYVMLFIHFAISILIMLTGVWITSFYSDIHPNAYIDAATTIVYIYPVIIVGGVSFDWLRTARVNRLLKKRLEEKHHK